MQTKILRQLCSIPTAPFAEQHVVEYVKSFVAARPRLRLTSDRFGNLLIQLPGATASPRLVFTAHMDHPGCVAIKMLDATTLRADFRGGVLADYIRGTKLQFVDDRKTIAGRVLTVEKIDQSNYPTSLTVRVATPVSPGSPGVFDQGISKIRSGNFYSRVCDDLAGAAACLTMLDELRLARLKSSIAVLLTRAEEVGFIGAIGAARYPKLLKKSDRLIAIECSSAQPYAPLGNGTIIRVGDRLSIFNSSLTHFITTQAQRLAGKDKRFRYQRALMPGGVCEATVYDIYGYTAASICVPLANYHNMDRQCKQIAPEYINLSDWQNMTRLFVHLARTAHQYQPGHRQLKDRLEQRFVRWRSLLGKPKAINS
jgi:putative aminopeptidase FrvX